MKQVFSFAVIFSGILNLDVQPYNHPIVGEEGFEFDKFILTKDREYMPGDGLGPPIEPKSGKVPSLHAMDQVSPGHQKNGK